MSRIPAVPAHETRWPVILTVLVTILLLKLLPARIMMVPSWLPWLGGAVVLTPIAGVGLSRGRAVWLRLERAVIRVFASAVLLLTLVNLGNLIYLMVNHSSQVSGLQLFTSSIGVWVNNVIIFTLFYWQIDRGGPEARQGGLGIRPDWLFPMEGAPPEVAPEGWHPTFVDYLFLGFTTSTAFSPTEALPMSHRAKLLMMAQSSISLATILTVAARAINILGS